VAGWVQWIVRNQRFVALLLGVATLLALAVLAAAALQAVVWSAVLPAWLEDNSRVLPAPGDAHDRMLLAAWVIWAFLFALTMFAAGFLNNSTFHRFYCARLVRTFLGAANFLRLAGFRQAMVDNDARAARRLFVSTAHEADDMALRSYYGVPSGGPLHLINVTLNESLSPTSQLQSADRRGIALCVSPGGIGVGDRFYAWQRDGQRPAFSDAASIGYRIAAAADSKAPAADLLRRAAELLAPNRTLERLSVGAWGAISGAAVSTGLGTLSAAGFSLLAWIVNARLGYWWQPSRVMCGQVDRADHLPNAYRLAWQEMTGSFRGRPDRYWHLSDGGHFENLGVYELVRRRVPLVIAADNTSDPKFDFDNLENLVRRVRVDFGAEVRFFGNEELDDFARRWLHEVDSTWLPFATLEEFKDPALRARRCAMLAWILHPLTDEAAPSRTLLVLIKPNLVEDAAVDLSLYAREHPEFPQQTTADQFFDEAQWESYRKLGVECGLRVFAHWDRLVEAAAESIGRPWIAPPAPYPLGLAPGQGETQRAG
jgi:hypothetical protein